MSALREIISERISGLLHSPNATGVVADDIIETLRAHRDEVFEFFDGERTGMKETLVDTRTGAEDEYVAWLFPAFRESVASGETERP